MKNKILFFLLIIIIFSKNVYAEVFYGEYRKTENIDTYKEDTLKINSYKLYNTYLTEYLDMGYLLENDDYIIDKNDYIEDLIEVSPNEESDEYININATSKTTFRINFNKIPENMKIYEIEVFYEGKKIHYSFIDSDKTGLNNLNDHNLETYLDGSIRNIFRLNLYYNYPLKDLAVIIYTKSNEDYLFNFYTTKENTDIKLLANKEKHIITFNNNEKQEEYVEYKYKTIKKLHRHYKEEKRILNNYIEEGNNIILDDYKEINEYYIRDKLVLKDDLIINNKDMRINDLIEYSTKDVHINCNIDYEMNGIYSCNFILEDINISKDIIVDIPREEYLLKNDTKVTKEPTEETKTTSNIEETNNYELEIIENNKKIINNNKTNKKNTQKKELKNKTVFQNKINTMNHKETTTKKVNIVNIKNSKESVNEKNDKKLLKIVKYIIIINLTIIEILLYIKKRKREKVESV